MAEPSQRCALVLVPGIGIEIAGSRRWFDLGFTTIQPSEFAKIATILALSALVPRSRGDEMQELGNVILSLLIVGVPMLLVFRQPDLGSSLVYAVIWISIMTVAHMRKRYWAFLLVAAPAVIIAGVGVPAPGLPAQPLDRVPRSGIRRAR